MPGTDTFPSDFFDENTTAEWTEDQTTEAPYHPLERIEGDVDFRGPVWQETLPGLIQRQEINQSDVTRVTISGKQQFVIPKGSLLHKEFATKCQYLRREGNIEVLQEEDNACVLWVVKYQCRTLIKVFWMLH